MNLYLTRIINIFVLSGVALSLAFTALPADAATLVVVSNADSGAGTLREAISASSAGDIIQFDENQVVSPIVLTSGEVLIDHDLTITGPTTTGLTISGNNASRVFDIQSGTVSISSLTISNGTDADSTGNSLDGAGIFNSGTLSLSNCTISDNHAIYFGGGIFNDGTLSVTNCTVFGNSAENDNGGGISNVGTLSLSNCTISGNSAYWGGGGLSNEIGAESTTVKNTIIAGNFNDTWGYPYGNPDVRGTFISGGYNLIGQIDGGDGFTGPGDQIGAIASPLDPQFDPAGLSDNGGSTLTISLQASSPALDAGDPAFAGPPDFDQRGDGYPRVQNGRVDIGAFETQAPTTLGFRPAKGNVGSPVKLTGANFSYATRVDFARIDGRWARAGFRYNANDKTITVAVPDKAITGKMRVTDSSGVRFSTTSFKVLPAVTVLNPTRGRSGTLVTLTGKTFTGATAVKFNGKSGTSFTVKSDTQITVTVPATAISGPISVTNAGGTATSATTFTTK